MKKNLVWITLFIDLLSVTALCGWFVLRPAEVRALAGMDEETTAKLMETITDTGNLVLADAGAATGRSTAGGDSETTGTTPRTVGPPPKRPSGPPPPRANADTESVARTAAVAVSKGIWTGTIPAEPPAPELYPFRVDRRRFPDDTNIQLEMSVQNASGFYWEDATIVFKSPGFPRAVAFHVGTWRIDQVAKVTYEFPQRELQERVELLRIVAVTGKRTESSLAAHMGKRRAEMAEMYGSKEQIEIGQIDVSPETGEASEFRVIVPAAFEGVNTDIDLANLPDTPQGARAKELIAAAGASATSVADSILLLVEKVNADGYESAMADEESATLLATALKSKGEFEKAGMDLALLCSRTGDESVRGLAPALNQLSDDLFLLIDSVEKQLQVIDPEFSLASR